jgi:serine/threonine protein kinase
MGEVWKARDTRLDRTVAIKVLPPDLTTDAAARQRFDREARAVAALSHPHICRLFDIGQQDGTDFLVMEYLDGETLAAVQKAATRALTRTGARVSNPSANSPRSRYPNDHRAGKRETLLGCHIIVGSRRAAIVPTHLLQRRDEL